MTEYVTDPPRKATERRKGAERRQVSDRREEVRFEPGKDSNRRVGRDRRRQGGWNGAYLR